MPYIKAHPFGYKKAEKTPSKHKGDILTGLQKCLVKVPYEVTLRDCTGAPVMEGKKPVKQVFFNTYVRTMRVFTPKPKRGRTLGDMVYESYPV